VRELGLTRHRAEQNDYSLPRTRQQNAVRVQQVFLSSLSMMVAGKHTPSAAENVSFFFPRLALLNLEVMGVSRSEVHRTRGLESHPENERSTGSALTSTRSAT